MALAPLEKPKIILITLKWDRNWHNEALKLYHTNKLVFYRNK